MDKIRKEIEESSTISQLLVAVNKKENRTRKDYIKYYVPSILIFVAIYASLILLIIFGIKKYIYSLIITVTVIVGLCGYGVFDKYMSLKIFKKIRQKELDNLK